MLSEKIFNKLKQHKQKKYAKTISKAVQSCGENLSVYGKIDLIYPKNITLGRDVSINHGVYINAFNPINIGNDVTISAGVKIVSTGIDYIGWATNNKQHTRNQGIVIGDHVWLGVNSVILENVKITGKYVIVAAGAVVTKDIQEDYCIVAGCPAKIIKDFKEQIKGEI